MDRQAGQSLPWQAALPPIGQGVLYQFSVVSQDQNRFVYASLLEGGEQAVEQCLPIT
jgi:hypothetical protein